MRTLEPNEFPRRVLVCVIGLVPQVVTETLHALVTSQQPPFVPNEIHLISSSDGIKRAELTLLSEDQRQLARFCSDYRVAVPKVVLHTIYLENGVAVDDIRTRDDNAAAADAITRLVAELTTDAHAALHVSIAGGRKTMGYYLGYALSLFGRPQDRLSHVLVTAPFENLVDFYYPTPDRRVLHTRDGTPVDAHEAQVDLAEIPFVRLRDEMLPLLTEQGLSFNQVVRAAERLRQPATVKLRTSRGTLDCDGVEVALSGQDWLTYAWFAWRRRYLPAREVPVRRKDLAGESHAWFAHLSDLKRDLSTRGWHYDPDAAQDWKRDDVTQWLSERMSKINLALRDALGAEALARRYAIVPSERSAHAKHLVLAVEPQHIAFVP